MSPTNDGSRFDRLPASNSERLLEDRPTRDEVIGHLVDRYGIDPAALFMYTFWEKGAGKVWAFRADVPSPVAVEALGIHVLRTRQRHWKLTTDGAQLFGRWATRNVLTVPPDTAAAFWAGEERRIDAEVDDGYVIVAQELTDRPEPLGIGLYLEGELRSIVPKGRQRNLAPLAPKRG